MAQLARPYVILRHEQTDGTHWDLMLDLGEALATWQLKRDPASLVNPAAMAAIPALRIADHRRAYLEYEGPVSGNRGHVTRVDSGTYEVTSHSPCGWTIRLAGTLLAGEFKLSATIPDKEGTFGREDH
jgi:hypothetical protein